MSGRKSRSQPSIIFPSPAWRIRVSRVVYPFTRSNLRQFRGQLRVIILDHSDSIQGNNLKRADFEILGWTLDRKRAGTTVCSSLCVGKVTSNVNLWLKKRVHSVRGCRILSAAPTKARMNPVWGNSTSVLESREPLEEMPSFPSTGKHFNEHSSKF